MSPLRTRLAILGLGVLLVLAPTACSTTAVAPAPSGDRDGATGSEVVPGEDVFGLDSPWNVPVDDAPVDPDSAALLERSLLTGSAATPAPATVVLDVLDGAVPVVAGGTHTLVTCRQAPCPGGTDGGDLTLAVPDDVDPDPSHGGVLTVVEPGTGSAYDLGRARREDDGSLSTYTLRRWDLDGPGFSRPYVPGARGSGLPLVGGLVRPGELERCQVNHALALSLPGPAAGYFVQPASTTDGVNTAGAVPEGARLRLRADVLAQPPLDPDDGRALPFTDTQRRRADCLVTALQRYGAFVVGRAPVPTLHVERTDPGAGPPLLTGDELLSLRLTDFEVLDLTDQTRYPFPLDDTADDTADETVTVTEGD